MEIDISKLKELVSEPKATVEQIYKGLGFNNSPSFYYNLNKDPEARKIFESRPGARKSPKTKTAGKSAKKANTPPRNGNAKGASKDLLNKIRFEFEHIDIYGAVSEHFDDLRTEVAALL